MTTGWLVVNIVLVAVVAAIVGLPAVLIPHMLDRKTRVKGAKTPRTLRQPKTTRQAASNPGRVADGQWREVA
ncbi:MAG: hypothetical protein M3019_10550 [Candidatus Dormibacteraeota bacterium]|nr:hypothetical protein [Candidatus Dormibacteraeota bacterium]